MNIQGETYTTYTPSLVPPNCVVMEQELLLFWNT